MPIVSPNRAEPLVDGRQSERAMLVRRTEPVPFECVVRGYLSGSAWAEYRDTGTLAGEPLPAGLIESARVDPPLFRIPHLPEVVLILGLKIQGADVVQTQSQAPGGQSMLMENPIQDGAVVAFHHAFQTAFDRG